MRPPPPRHSFSYAVGGFLGLDRGEIIGNAVADKREKMYEDMQIGSDYMFRVDEVKAALHAFTVFSVIVCSLKDGCMDGSCIWELELEA